MRRRDREVTDFKEIVGIIDKCEVIRLGFVDDGKAYIVPLNFAYEEDGGQVTIVFHSALEGRKIDIMKENPCVCFEMDCPLGIARAETACEWSAEYESVIGYGDVRFIENDGEKKAAMDLIMKRYGYVGTPEYLPSVVSRTALYRLSVSELAGKRNFQQV